MRRLSLVFASGCAAQNTRGGGSNPMEDVRKQMMGMQEQLEHEREKNTELDKKVTCQCNSSIEKSQSIIVDKQTCIESETSTRDNQDGKASDADAAATKLEEEVKQKTADLEKTRKAKAAQHAADMTMKSDLVQLNESLSAALAALKEGQGNAAAAQGTGPKVFLQSQSKAQLTKIAKGLSLGKNLLNIQDILKPSQRRLLNAFVQQPDFGTGDDNLAGIVGMLDAMNDDAAKKLEELEKSYAKAMESFEEQISLLEKQIAEAKDGAATKRQRQQEATGKSGKAKTSLADCEKALADENKFLQDRIQECDDHKKQFAELMEQNAKEHTAVSQALEYVEEHRDSFTKMSFLSTSSSFLQVVEENKEVAEIESAIKSFKESEATVKSGRFAKLARRASLSLLLAKESIGENRNKRSSTRSKSLVSVAQKVTWKATVCKKIVEFIDEIKKTGEEDAAAHDSCKKDINKMSGTKKDLENEQASLEDKRAAREQEIETLEVEIEGLEDEKRGKKEDMAVATGIRERANAEFVVTTTDNKNAISVIKKIVAVMNNAFTATQTGTGAAGKGESFLLQQDADPNDRKNLKTFDKQQGGQKEGATVLAFLQQITNDVTLKNQNAEKIEQQQQSDYMVAVTDLSNAIKELEVFIADKEEAKAYAEEMMAEREQDITNTNADHKSTTEALEARQKDCKWLMDNLETRRNGQKLEIQALNNAQHLIRCGQEV